MKTGLAVLSSNQTEILLKLSFLSESGFYLAGGTALALQLGHRTSLDFDFYNIHHFDRKKLYDKIDEHFKNESLKISERKDTLFCNIKGIDLSFFWYSYPLITKPTIIKGVTVAGLADIAAMKLVAISHRPVKRDYIDIFFLLKKFTLKEMFGFVTRKYPKFNQYFAIRALTYFEDIKDDQKQRAIRILTPNFSWEEAKEKIFAEVKKYQLSMIKKD